MKLYGLIPFFLAGLFFLVSCNDDPPVIDSGFSLIGAYDGEYIIIENYNEPYNSEIRKQDIQWMMTDFTYNCTVDTSDPSVPPITCDFYGTYEINYNLFLDTAVATGNRAYSQGDLPGGEFDVFHVIGADGVDSLTLTQTDSVQNMRKIINLKQL